MEEKKKAANVKVPEKDRKVHICMYEENFIRKSQRKSSVVTLFGRLMKLASFLPECLLLT